MKSRTFRLPGRSLTPGTVEEHSGATLRGKAAVVGLLGVLFGLGAAGGAAGESVKVSWSGNPEPDISGYEVRYGTSSGDTSEVVSVGGNTRSTTIKGLDSGTRYYFTLVAVNTAGLRSVPSDETSFKTSGKAPNQAPNGWILTPSTSGRIYAGDTVSFTAGAGDPDAGDKLSYQWTFGAGSGVAGSGKLNPGAVRFNQPGSHTVTFTVTDQDGLADPTPSKRVIEVLPSALSVIPRSGWTLRYVDSEESEGYGAVRSFDGDPSTFWHTEFRTADYKLPPHELQIQLDVVRNIGGFRYLPRQDALNIGNITTYRFYVSMDGSDWGAPVASGTLDGTKGEKEVLFAAKKGRYIRLIALGDAGDSIHSNVAELNLLAAPESNRKPVAKGRTLKTKKNKKVKVKLKGSDPDGNPITYRIVRKPKKGKLTGVAPNLTYRPKRGFKGTDKIRYRVSDGKAFSRTVTVRIKVGGKKAKKSNSKKKSAVVASSRRKSPERTGTLRSDGETYKVLTVSKDGLRKGRRPVVQVSSDLLHWYSGSRHTTVLRDDDKVLRVRDNTPFAPGRKRYIRLRQVTR